MHFHRFGDVASLPVIHRDHIVSTMFLHQAVVRGCCVSSAKKSRVGKSFSFFFEISICGQYFDFLMKYNFMKIELPCTVSGHGPDTLRFRYIGHSSFCTSILRALFWSMFQPVGRSCPFLSIFPMCMTYARADPV